MPSATSQMQSISGIITQIHATTGEVPPPLVGASVTIVDDRVFVFAGRLIASRKMTNHMYALDLNTLHWTRHIPPPDSSKPPRPRYFHSADVYKRSIVVFGGMGYSRMSADGLCVLDDVSVFDVDSMTWKRPVIEPSLFAPQSRYAHLSAIVNNKLVIIGGQDMNNNYLGEINMLDLDTWEWVNAKSFDKHVGVYRSIAASCEPTGETALFGTRAKASAGNGNGNGNGEEQTTETVPIYLYTNFNFADVKREMQIITCSSTTVIEDYSSHMTGPAMPPGLRFPTGHTLGHHLILAGTYLSPQTQAFSIWSLDLSTLTWNRIETGAVFNSGSWNRGVLHSATNRYIVIGHKNRNLLEDYNNRQVNFNHIAMVDLEAFGIYEPPKMTCSALAQEMGLSLLNEPAVCDFRILTSDKQSVSVNSTILAQRWPYFAELLKNSNQKPAIEPLREEDEEDNVDPTVPTASASAPAPRTQCMPLPYAYPIVVALVQFLYTDNLLTAQQHQPHTLAQLLLLADMYELPRLRDLTTHALHQMLTMSTAPLIFETAALSHKTSLQVRALKMMIAAKKVLQQQQQPQQPQPLTQPQEHANGYRPETSMSMYVDTPPTSGGGYPQQAPTAYQGQQHTGYPYAQQRIGQRLPSEVRVSAMYDQQAPNSPYNASYRNRAPSLTPSQYSNPSSLPSQFGQTSYVESELYRYPALASSPPVTPHQGMGLPPDAGSRSPPISATSSWSATPRPVESISRSWRDTGRKKSNDNDKKFAESLANKIAMNFQ